MNVRFKYSTYFSAGVYYSDAFIINNYRINISFLTGTEDPEDQNIGLERIKYFIHNRLASGVFIEQNNQAQCQLFNSAHVPVTTLPLEPFDQVIGMALYFKLNAILEDRMIVTDIEISSDLGDNIWYLHSDDEPSGPFEELGWWSESDISQCDTNFIIDDKIVALTRNKTWADLELEWTDTQETETDNKLVLADFKKDETK